MPELPEVETTLNGIRPYLDKQKVTDVIIRHPSLRWPIPANLKTILQNQKVLALERRAKYILMHFKHGTLILHLGMSGKLSVLEKAKLPTKHDHVDIIFNNKICLRFTDHRRFGALLWAEGDASQHLLLKKLGIEPLEKLFDGKYLFSKTQKRKVPIKNLLMNSQIVAGIGNIYAAESLYLAGIHPLAQSASLTLKQCHALVKAIKTVLKKAIKSGGTTLKDFMKSDGTPGYFKLKLNVYGREKANCKKCHTLLTLIRMGNRSTVFCAKCQKL